MNIEELESAIKETESAFRPIAEKLERLRRELTEAKSREFIRVNAITRDTVERSEGETWFGTVWKFADWLKAKSSPRRWAEWNGRLYHTSDLIAGRMPETPALWEHVS